jgi:GPH family glycoside/pentoside/hexuronide:cation symporter
LVPAFLAAAISSPIWSALARRYGAKPVLLINDPAVASFVYTLTLSPGDVIPFAGYLRTCWSSTGRPYAFFTWAFCETYGRDPAKMGRRGLVFEFGECSRFASLRWFCCRYLNDPAFRQVLRTCRRTPHYADGAYALVPSLLKLAAIGLLIATKLED